MNIYIYYKNSRYILILLLILLLTLGPRILTLFLYLSDVEEGGETVFPALGVSVKPKKGRALLWPSTLDLAPEIRDGRTTHEARPIIKGRKFAANVWVHLYNNEIAAKWACTGNTGDSIEDPNLKGGFMGPLGLDI